MSANEQSLSWAVASDHGGFKLKKFVVELLQQWGLVVSDLGTHSAEPVDYPEFAARVARGVAQGRFGAGVLICGSGVGMSISANRFPNVRAVLCTSVTIARLARAHNDANVLCLGERITAFAEVEDILRVFRETRFEGGRHSRRVAKIDSVLSQDAEDAEDAK